MQRCIKWQNFLQAQANMPVKAQTHRQYRINIEDTHIPYPYGIRTDIDLSNQRTFQVSLNASNFKSFTPDEVKSLPDYYKAHLAHARFAISCPKFRSLEFSYDYPSQLAILGLSDATNISPLIACAKVGKVVCNRKRLCPYCARNDGAKRFAMLEELYPHAGWGFLTISYQGGSMSFSAHEHIRWLNHWSAASEAVQRLIRQGDIPGALIREEMAINSFDPPSCLPHVHAIISTGTLEETVILKLDKFIHGYRNDEGEGIDLAPDISFKTIEDLTDFKNKVYYTVKAVDFVAPYTNFFHTHPNPGPHQIELLNRTVRDSTESYLAGTHGRTQCWTAGNMDRRTRSSLSKSNVYVAT